MCIGSSGDQHLNWTNYVYMCNVACKPLTVIQVTKLANNFCK